MHTALSFYVTGQVSRQAAQPLCAMPTLLLASRSVPGLGFLGGWSPMQSASVKLRLKHLGEAMLLQPKKKKIHCLSEKGLLY